VQLILGAVVSFCRPKGGSCGGKKRTTYCPSRRGWHHCNARRLQLHLGYLDKLLLVPADPSLVAYVWVVIEVPAATNQNNLSAL
jgi:hypothetical protein